MSDKKVSGYYITGAGYFYLVFGGAIMIFVVCSMLYYVVSHNAMQLSTAIKLLLMVVFFTLGIKLNVGKLFKALLIIASLTCLMLI